jgi:hypothetical protein
MEQEDSELQQVSPTKTPWRRFGGGYILTFIILFIVNLFTIKIPGILPGLINLAMIGFLVVAIIFVIRGFIRK